MAHWKDELRQARERAGWSQHELARQATVAQKPVANYELGKHRPTRDTLLKLARALRLDPTQTDALLEGAGFDPLPVGRVADFERRRLPFPLLQEAVDRYIWPCLVMSDEMDILLWNAAAVRVAELDFGDALPELPQRNLMRVVALEHFRERVRNWNDVAGVMIALLKADFDDPEQYAEAMPYFNQLVQDLSTKPQYLKTFPELMQL